jgi:hypothetical protein
MALLHHATMTPTKLELIAAWLPRQPWYDEAPGSEVERVSAYRFDDPAGQVGIETMLIRAAGSDRIWQVPLTYRGAPLDGAEQWLIGTTEHSVLGTRWVYDGCGDPVYAATLTDAIFGRIAQAVEYFEVEGELQARPSQMAVSGTGESGPEASAIVAVTQADPAGIATVITTETAELTVLRVPDLLGTKEKSALTGSWPGQSNPALLAHA